MAPQGGIYKSWGGGGIQSIWGIGEEWTPSGESTSRRNRVNHWGGVILSKICIFAFKFLKFAHFLAHLGGGGGGSGGGLNHTILYIKPFGGV